MHNQPEVAAELEKKKKIEELTPAAAAQIYEERVEELGEDFTKHGERIIDAASQQIRLPEGEADKVAQEIDLEAKLVALNTAAKAAAENAEENIKKLANPESIQNHPDWTSISEAVDAVLTGSPHISTDDLAERLSTGFNLFDKQKDELITYITHHRQEKVSHAKTAVEKTPPNENEDNIPLEKHHSWSEIKMAITAIVESTPNPPIETIIKNQTTKYHLTTNQSAELRQYLTELIAEKSLSPDARELKKLTPDQQEQITALMNDIVENEPHSSPEKVAAAVDDLAAKIGLTPALTMALQREVVARREGTYAYKEHQAKIQQEDGLVEQNLRPVYRLQLEDLIHGQLIENPKLSQAEINLLISDQLQAAGYEPKVIRAAQAWIQRKVEKLRIRNKLEDEIQLLDHEVQKIVDTLVSIGLETEKHDLRAKKLRELVKECVERTGLKPELISNRFQVMYAEAKSKYYEDEKLRTKTKAEIAEQIDTILPGIMDKVIEQGLDQTNRQNRHEKFDELLNKASAELNIPYAELFEIAKPYYRMRVNEAILQMKQREAKKRQEEQQLTEEQAVQKILFSVGPDHYEDTSLIKQLVTELADKKELNYDTLLRAVQARIAEEIKHIAMVDIPVPSKLKGGPPKSDPPKKYGIKGLNIFRRKK